jgi:hypothetical protein
MGEIEKKEKSLPRLFMPLRSERIFKFGTMDIEASEWTHVVRVGFYDGKEFRGFDTLLEAMEYFMQRKYSNWRCFLHNMAGYDGQFIIEALAENFDGYKFEILSNNGASMIRVYPKSAGRKYHPYSWTFLDSYRLLPKSLKDLTHSFDVEHKKLDDIDFKNIKADPAKLERYLMYDCMGLYEVLKKFEGWFKKYKVPLMPTTPSQAMAVYRRMMDYPIPTLAPEVEKFVRKAYYGGRTEIFKMKCDKKLNLYDVNSLYPSVMAKYPMPVGTPKRVTDFVEGAVGFYHCRVYVPEMYLPPLPYNMNGKLIFPCGRFEGYYSSIEIELAKSLGCKVTVKDGYVFPSDYIFKKYVDTFYELKKNGDEVTKAIAKLMLVALYGKFGQNREKFTIVKPDPNHLKGLIPIPEMQEFGLYQKKTVSRAVFIIPSISAWVTACARVELYKWMQKAGNENIYYADSVTADTPLLIRRHGKFVDFMEIQELNPTSKLRYDRHGRGFQDIEIMSRNGWTRINYVYKHKVDKPVFTLAGNIYCKVTGDHSVFKNGAEVKVSSLKVGDSIDTGNIPDTPAMSGITENYARLLGFFVAEGSCGTYDTKWGEKNSWALNCNNNDVLEKYKNIMESVFSAKFKILDCMESSNINKLVPVGDIKNQVRLFERLCYTKSGNKKVPTIIFNSTEKIMRAFLEGYMEGDGSPVNRGFDKSGQKRNDSISFILQAGISFLSKKIGYESSFYIRDDKPNVITHMQSMKSKKQIRRIRTESCYDYVYDISTDDGTFVGGCGLVLFHNTDSVFSTKSLPVSDDLGAMKLESSMDKAIFLLPKMYITQVGDEVKVKAKGFERDFAKTLTMDSFQKALKGDTKDFHQVISRFGKFKEVWRREGKFVSMLTKKKSVKTVYSKRHIGKDFNTFPLTINECPLLECYDGRTKASRQKSIEALKFV